MTAPKPIRQVGEVWWYVDHKADGITMRSTVDSESEARTMAARQSRRHNAVWVQRQEPSEEETHVGTYVNGKLFRPDPEAFEVVWGYDDQLLECPDPGCRWDMEVEQHGLGHLLAAARKHIAESHQSENGEPTP